MNTKVEEALGVLNNVPGSSPEGGYADVIEATATLAAHIAQQDATIARLEKKLIRYEVNNNTMARAAMNQEQGK